MEIEGRPVLVLAHGLGVDHRMWEPQLTDFETSYHVFNWDLPGFGKEPAICFGDKTPLVATADWLAKRMEKEGLANVYLVGYSMGSMLSILIALRHPHLVGRLGLLAAAARWGGGFRVLSIPIIQIVALLLRKQVVRELTPVITDPEELAVMKDMLRLCDTKVMAELLRDLMLKDMRDKVGAISAPVLLIGGSKDELANPSRFRDLENALHDPRVLYIDGGKHFFCVTHAELVAKTVVSFGLEGGGHGNQA